MYWNSNSPSARGKLLGRADFSRFIFRIYGFSDRLKSAPPANPAHTDSLHGHALTAALATRVFRERKLSGSLWDGPLPSPIPPEEPSHGRAPSHRLSRLF